ncbi:MAG: lipopolysaccharide heptosyltransferase family protein [Bacteroidetes bacterium]|nr:lipopolysaccharide heptosyltransferase family protein [Bacteroidota bacterium]
MAKSNIKIPDCINFNGYKPCYPYTVCYDECKNPQPFGTRILIICLEAMGAVLQTTAMLAAIKRKYPQSHITWITLKNAIRLLDNNPLINSALVWNSDSQLILQQMKFDILFSVDKTKHSCAFANTITANKKFGFGLNGNGVIIPFNKEAEYLYRLGLDDQLKFKENKKYGTEILQEAMDLKFERDPYILQLSDAEKKYCDQYKSENLSKNKLTVGFNTGCSILFPNKKMTIEQHLYLINSLSKNDDLQIVLVGGPEDTDRNNIISERADKKILNTPTTNGIRKGICYENICDLIITGDSFGMHIAIALQKYVIVWFGLSCSSEIDLYDNGIKLIPTGLECSPCWKKECPYDLECIQLIDLDKIILEVNNYAKKIKN